MTAKEFLNRAYVQSQRVQYKSEQLIQLKSTTQRVTAALDSEYVSHTRNVRALEDAVIHVIEATEQLQIENQILADIRKEISQVIDQVSSITFQSILSSRYLCFKNWEDIAQERNRTVRWVQNQHKQALIEIEKIIEKTFLDFA